MKQDIDYLRGYVNDLMEDLDALEAARPQHMNLDQLKEHTRHIENFDDLILTLTKEIKTVQIEALEHVISRETQLNKKSDFLTYAGRYHKQLTEELAELEKNGLT